MIGQYVLRVGKNGAAVSMAHLIESEVAERLLTHCGHYMHRRTARGQLRTAGPLDQRCSLCPERVHVQDQPEPVASEQDDYDGAAAI